MGPSLRDIPGANRRTTFRRRRATYAPRLGPPILIDPRASLYDRVPTRGPGRRPALRDRRPRIAPVDMLLALGVVTIVAFLGWKLWDATRVNVEVTGIEDDGAITFQRSETLDVRIKVDPAGRLDGATLLLDGEDIGDVAEQLDDGYRWRTDRPLTAGEHELVLTVPRPILPASRFTWSFLIDAVPPRIDVPSTLLDPVDIDDRIQISGRVDTDATLTANGDEVDIDDDGRFELDLDRPPAGPINLTAVDKAGQTSIKEIFVPIKRPVTRGVHMSAISWSQKDLRQGVLDLIDRGVINTVELDLKDESGEVGWDTSVPLAKEIGAVKRYYDLDDAIDALHERGVRVIGRVVAFRDPILARAAWDAGDRDWVVQDRNGQPHKSYGGFTNFLNRDVRAYNIALAMDAVDRGVDEILWDYVRRPEGALDAMVIPGLGPNDSVAVGVASFLKESHDEVRAGGALQGASLFGIASIRPETIGQSVPLIAKSVDYIAPMVYPSLWVPNEYRVPDPARMPYRIVRAALEDFQKKVKGTGVTLVPWLQDFSLGADYGANEVAEQVRAAVDLGIGSWLLWSPRVRYHGERLERM